jgi:arsenate reductase
MTKLNLYGLKNCDTCKKAMKAFEQKGIDYNFIDIRAEADLVEKLPTWLNSVGVEKLLNKRSTTWRSLTETEQEAALSEKNQTTLENNPTLIKRPVIEIEKTIYVGWTKDVQEDLI